MTRTATAARPRRQRRLLTGAVAAALLAGTSALSSPVAAQAAPDRPWMDTSLSPLQRAELLLPQMTLAEEVDLVTGDQGKKPAAYYNSPIERLGIPELRMADAGGGIADRGWTLPGTGAHATAFPSGAALGATWDPSMATLYGGQVAAEVRGTGQEMLLGPGSDLSRQPFNGRAGESPSEDPLLTADIDTPYVKAVQHAGVIATLKHYLAYTQETDRGAGQNSILDERALHEVYALPYADAIKKADLGAVMCSFNKINGTYSCENDETLDSVLRHDLGFTGFVLTDFGAIHSTVPSIQAGTDMATGSAAFYDSALLAAVQDGRVSRSLVDRSVLRILRTMFAVGIFDRDYTPTGIDAAAGGAVAQKVQENAITLLQNKSEALPLSSSVRSIAVIGGDVDVTSRVGGSFAVRPTYERSLLTSFRDKASSIGATLRYAPGNDPVNAANMIETADMTAVPSSVLTPASGSGTGLTAQHFATTTFSGASVTRTERQALYDTGFTGGAPAFASLYASQVPPRP